MAKKIHSKKELFSNIAVLFILAVFLVLTVFVLKKQTKLITFGAADAQLFVPTSSLTVTQGKNVLVPIYVSTKESLMQGVDVLMSFDKSKLQLVDVDTNAINETSFKTFLPTVEGKLDLLAVTNKANSSGKIAFSAITFDYSTKQVTTAFKGTVQLVTLKFLAISTGTVPLQFDFIPSGSGSTTESNVVIAGGTDVLGSTTGVTVQINPTSTPSPLSASPTPTPGENQSNVIKVSKIVFEGSGKNFQDSILVVNQNNQGLQGANVTRLLRNSNTGQTWKLTSTTAADGWTWSNRVTYPAGCYSIKITTIVKSGFTFNNVTPTNKYCTTQNVNKQ